MVTVIWTIVAALILIFFWWANRLIAADQASDRFDPGLAIIEFGRAFPDEAIREVVLAVDGSMIFLRLWDGRAGCMKPVGNRYHCHIVEAGRVSVRQAEDPRSLVIEFPGTSMPGGTFQFRTPREAGEVSLWLLGSFVPVARTAGGPEGLSPA